MKGGAIEEGQVGMGDRKDGLEAGLTEKVAFESRLEDTREHVCRYV